MSHFSKIKTNFKSIDLLKKSITELNILGKLEISSEDSKASVISIVQENKTSISFQWTGTEYELVTDLFFWQQPVSVESFLSSLTQRYAHNVIVSEGSREGFNSVDTVKCQDGSINLVLQRWV